MNEDETWRLHLLLRACRDGESGDIEGVRFELYHEDLNRNEWEPGPLLGWPYERDASAPRLVFPWYTPIQKLMWMRMDNAIEVHVGDVVRIASVKSVGLNADHGNLDHPHHRERRWATLVIEQSSGRAVTVGSAWQFSGVADVMGPIQQRDYKQVRSALLARLANALGLEDVDDVALADSPDDWPAFGDDVTQLDRMAAHAVWAAESEYVEEAAMAFGYLIGRAEARRFLLPHAEHRLELRENRRRNAAKPRRRGNETRAAAIRIIDRDPNILLDRCAKQVATERGLSDDRGVRRTIASLFAKAPDGKMRPNAVAVAEARVLLEGI